jgi:hypothetical protein
MSMSAQVIVVGTAAGWHHSTAPEYDARTLIRGVRERPEGASVADGKSLDGSVGAPGSVAAANACAAMPGKKCREEQ